MQQKNPLLVENLSKIKHKIVVMSGKGGVGKSSVSVNLAVGLALQGKRVGILDVDIHGPSIAKMTGIEGKVIHKEKDSRPKPIESVNNLFVLTIASMLENPDEPIIWRGPAKMAIIEQFLSEIEWPELDFLVVDCPPGTGDEPLSIIQLIGNPINSIIVTTPQDIALLDVRKSINFAKKLDMTILGIVENMAGFICPHCNKKSDIFKSGGADKASTDFNIPVLGKIPLDINMVHAADEGKPFIYHYSKTEGGKVIAEIVQNVLTSFND